MPLLSALNRLLPFATPGTPIVQDLAHLAAICVLLYFAPQIQEAVQTRQARASNNGEAVEIDTNTADEQQPAAALIDAPSFDEEPAHEEVLDQTGFHADHGAVQPGIDDDAGIADGEPGPAQRPNAGTEQRNVGAKKAKALARKDQRRAYHEFQRSQGDAQRARDAEGAAEREEALAAERERRRVAAAALEAKRAEEREERRAREDAQRDQEQRRRDQAVDLVRTRLQSDRMCDLFRVAREIGVDDEEWVERIVRASGLVGRRGETLTIITDTVHVASVSANDMRRVYEGLLAKESAAMQDRIDSERVAEMLQQTIQAESCVESSAVTMRPATTVATIRLVTEALPERHDPPASQGGVQGHWG